MNLTFDKDDLFKASAILLMGFNVWQSRRATKEALSHIGEFGTDQSGKRKFAHKVLTNFYLLAAASFIMVAGILGFLSHDLFLVSFYSVLAALGVKLAIDSK